MLKRIFHTHSVTPSLSIYGMPTMCQVQSWAQREDQWVKHKFHLDLNFGYAIVPYLVNSFKHSVPHLKKRELDYIIFMVLSVLKEMILQCYDSIFGIYTVCLIPVYEFMRLSSPNLPNCWPLRLRHPIISWPTLPPSVPCSQQPWRIYNYTWMSPICCNSFASLIF